MFSRETNLTNLNKHFSRKSGASGSKDGSTMMETKLQKQKEEAIKLQKVKTEKRLKEEADKRQVEEAQRKQEEERLRKEIE